MPSVEVQTHPRLCQGLAVVPICDGLVVDGAPRRRVLRGADTSAVLPRIMPLLDGTHDRAELCDLSGLTGSQLDQVLTLLDQSGLLDGSSGVADANDVPHVPAEAAMYLSRTVSATGYSDSAELGAVLASSAVHVIGTAELCSKVAADLAATGVAIVRSSDLPPRAAGAEFGNAGRGLVVVEDQARQPDIIEQAVKVFAPTRTPVLRVARPQGSIEIGPVFLDGHITCPDCLRRALRNPPWDSSEHGHPAPGDLDVCAGLITTEVLAYLSQLTPPPAARRLIRLTCGNWEAEEYMLVPESDCDTCGPSAPATDDDAAAADRYEWSVAQLPDAAEPEAADSPSHREFLRQLMTERAVFPTQPRTPLPGRHPLGELTGVFGIADAAALVDLVTLVGGLREPGRNDSGRWAPTGGNMASVQLYVVAETDPFGLPGTIFRYDDLAHAMRAMHPEHIPIDRILEATDLSGGDFAAVVVFTADIPRLARKYQQFATRLAHLDAGCAATQLTAAGRCMGLHVQFAASWDDQLPAWFDHAPADELVTAVAGISSGRASRSA